MGQECREECDIPIDKGGSMPVISKYGSDEPQKIQEFLEVSKPFDVSEVIQGTSLLKLEDIDFLNEHASQFEQRFNARSIFRSKFEMEASVLNDDVHPTPDSKYFQAIGEQNVHLTELISLIYNVKKGGKDIELKGIDLDEVNLQLKRLHRENVELCERISKPDAVASREDADRLDELPILINRKEKEIEKLELELDELKFNIKQSNKVAQERIREVKQWEAIIAKLVPQLEFGIEDFELHHPKRYVQRYGRRAMHLDILNPEDKENVVSHFLSFAGHTDNKEEAKKFLKDMVTVGGMPMNHGLVKALQASIGQPNLQQLSAPDVKRLDQDYPSKEIANLDDPVVKSFFIRKTLKILVCSPHRLPTDKIIMNMWALQTPAAFDCQLWEPHGMSVAEARTSSIKKAIAEGYQFIQWIDDDMILPRNALVQLISHVADIVGGFYYRKYEPIESCGMHEYVINNEMVPRPIKDFKIGEVIHHTLVLPSGCTLLNLDIFKNEKMEEPWYRTVTITGAPAITEDTYFCQKARLAGYDVLTDTGVQCIHVDLASNRIFGHPEVVDMSKNIILNPYNYCL